MRPSTKEEIQRVADLILSVRKKIDDLLQQGKKIHFIWDFDGILASPRSDDVFALINSDLNQYFAYEERFLLESPEPGPWLLPIAHNTGAHSRFPNDKFTQDIVTARSSTLAIRVHIFCLSWQLPIRWILFLGHQSKLESYRIILQSLKSDADYYIFCVDDNTKNIDTFRDVAQRENMTHRTCGIVSPTIRRYSEEDLKKYFNCVMGAEGNSPLRVRDPLDDMRGFIVLPGGVKQFQKQINGLLEKTSNQGHSRELRNAFIQEYGEVGCGHFKTEEDLERAMNEFIVGHWV